MDNSTRNGTTRARVDALEARMDELEHDVRLIKYQVVLARVAVGLPPGTHEDTDVKIAKGELNAIRQGTTLTAVDRDTAPDSGFYGCCECGWLAETDTRDEAEALCVSHVDEVHKEFVALYPDLSGVSVAKDAA